MIINAAISDTAFSRKFGGLVFDLKNLGTPQKNIHFVVLAP